ncbi:MAG TPA: patatin-like phospholipase family protein [Acetobacteraceae bacterium]|nr:patatin-like phospholipase family protein [Acetobacteraceae bacterium]
MTPRNRPVFAAGIRPQRRSHMNRRSMMPAKATAPTATPAVPYDKIAALVLQGGGALGSYQAGVYEALAGSHYMPDWVAGISIGAINAAIIAGNEPENRVVRLRDFWDLVTAPSSHWPRLPGVFFDEMYRHAGALSALAFGQPGFFERWDSVAWFFGGFPASYYDTSPLRLTLERFVDFDRINARKTRFSVGAVNVRTGNLTYFDNHEIEIRPEHVMASCALPPGFPAVEVDGELFWDGGLVSNTPLQYVLSYYPRRSRLTFQVDIFPARGPLPRTIDEVLERAKEIQYSSRTRMGTDQFRAMHDIRHNLNLLLEKVPETLKARPEARFLSDIACVTTMDVAQVIYRPDNLQGASKDFEFSRATMESRWAQGLADAGEVLRAAPWLDAAPPEVGVRVFDVIRDLRAASPRRLD